MYTHKVFHIENDTQIAYNKIYNTAIFLVNYLCFLYCLLSCCTNCIFGISLLFCIGPWVNCHINVFLSSSTDWHHQGGHVLSPVWPCHSSPLLHIHSQEQLPLQTFASPTVTYSEILEVPLAIQWCSLL